MAKEPTTNVSFMFANRGAAAKCAEAASKHFKHEVFVEDVGQSAAMVYAIVPQSAEFVVWNYLAGFAVASGEK